MLHINMLSLVSIESIPHLLGILAFGLHILAYTVYGYHIFKGRIRPNAISWFMWLTGGVIEYLTYDALLGSQWFTSALPLACVVGISGIFLITLYAQVMERLKKKSEKAIYHKPEKLDYYLTSFDLGAGVIWVVSGAAAFANFLAVSTSILTFIPIWKTTLKHGEEHPAPWILWSAAYLCMFLAVLFEGGEGIYSRLFYPGYYFVLHFVMALLAYETLRRFILKKYF